VDRLSRGPPFRRDRTPVAEASSTKRATTAFALATEGRKARRAADVLIVIEEDHAPAVQSRNESGVPKLERRRPQ
jgi:hypothetical protein